VERPRKQEQQQASRDVVEMGPNVLRMQLPIAMPGLGHVNMYALLDDRGAAIERILRLRDEGKTRFAGITGHDLSVARTHLEALRRYDLDTVMFPVYPRLWADAVYREAAEALLAECEARDVGVMVIKAAAARPWARDGERHSTTWYEPQTAAADVERGVRFALSTPGVTAFCTPGDLQVLELALQAAESFEPMSDEEREAAMAASDDELIFPIPV